MRSEIFYLFCPDELILDKAYPSILKHYSVFIAVFMSWEMTRFILKNTDYRSSPFERIRLNLFLNNSIKQTGKILLSFIHAIFLETNVILARYIARSLQKYMQCISIFK